MKVLVTGASGYIGRQLAGKLLLAGHEVTGMVRDAARVQQGHGPQMNLVEADALQAETLPPALNGIDVAYYLIHSMSGQVEGFEERDHHAAQNFATTAKQCGVRRVIYLGGLASTGASVSAHLKSRHETGAVLRKFGPPLIELRAGIIVGNGSTSFEIIRCLTERLPVMICPRWVVTRTQPIAVSAVLEYLQAALEVREAVEEPIEVGGSTIETYRSMMLEYARQRGLRRWLVRVPVLTPRLSSYWLYFVTPVPAAVSRPLIEGLRSESICTDGLAGRLFPSIHAMSYDDAVQRALERPAPSMRLPSMSEGSHQTFRGEGIICDIRETIVDAPRERVFKLIGDVGGRNGWFYANFLWSARGWIDRLMGGVGMNRGRARASGMETGDVIDFWQVERVDAPSVVLLRAEMKLPGEAWLQFNLTPQHHDRTLLRCCAWFQPRGLAGEIYWCGLYPVHALIFFGMLRAIRNHAEQSSCAGGAAGS
jgi:uncharacterized protein YbjT (DUF2867 family)/uncharacterized protein YndB with AHSA1/START domain